MRVLMVKSAHESSAPKTTQEAVARAVAVLNTITVPMGDVPGTDSGPHSAEMGLSDHTLWGVVRDHASRTVYWRSASNPSLQRLRLSDVDFGKGAPSRSLAVTSGPWYVDAAIGLR